MLRIFFYILYLLLIIFARTRKVKNDGSNNFAILLIIANLANLDEWENKFLIYFFMTLKQHKNFFLYCNIKYNIYF